MLKPIHSQSRSEPSDVPARPTLMALPGILLSLLVSALLVRFIYPRTAIDRPVTAPLPRYSSPMHEPVLPPARHERSDVTVRAALIAFLSILVCLLISVLLVRWIYPGTAVDRRQPTPPPTYPSPRLQADPVADMQKFLSAELARLNSAGWDDQTKKLGHISIDDAMRRIAASGIPDWPK